MSLDHVSFGYHARRPVIQDLSAHVHPARVHALIGPNASGKSTLLGLMLGRLQPWSGRITLGGSELKRMRGPSRAARMSYVPQRSSVGFAYSVREVVAMGRYALPPDERAIERALEDCDLLELRERPYSELSVGQQQRVLLARALSQAEATEGGGEGVWEASGGGKGGVMLLDEPTGGMDLVHVHRTMQSLCRKAHQRGLGVVVVVHDINLAARYADEVWLLDQGRLVAAGHWSGVLRPEILEPVYRVRLEAVPRGERKHGREGDASARPWFAVSLADDAER